MGLSIEGGIGVKDRQGQRAGYSEVEEVNAEEVIEEVVEVRLEAVVALREGHSRPDYGSSQPVDVAVHAHVGPECVRGRSAGSCRRRVKWVRSTVKHCAGECEKEGGEALGNHDIADTKDRQEAEGV